MKENDRIRPATLPATLSPLADGLDALRQEIGLAEIASLIERTARWVAPETFRLLPVWFPEHARGELFYKSNWSEPQTNTARATGSTIHKRESNTYAGKALTMALGLRMTERSNWSCCHIWGVDDPRYTSVNAIVRDRRFYSCVANMVLLPTPLKAFTDVMPEIKSMIRLCARNLYGWACDHHSLGSTPSELDEWQHRPEYPSSWPRSLGEREPLGLVPLSPRIEAAARRRIDQIEHDLNHAGPHYPRDEVLKALAYWGVSADRALSSTKLD